MAGIPTQLGKGYSSEGISSWVLVTIAWNLEIVCIYIYIHEGMLLLRVLHVWKVETCRLGWILKFGLKF